MTSTAGTPLSIVDLHSHLVPGVDDGTASVAESLDALGALHQEDVRSLVTTPHLLVPNLVGDDAVDRELERHRSAFDNLATSCEGRADLPAIALGQEICAPTLALLEGGTCWWNLGLSYWETTTTWFVRSRRLDAR